MTSDDDHPEPAEVGAEPDESGRYVCDVCGEWFDDEEALVTHVREQGLVG